VLYHSIFWQYLPVETQSSLSVLVAELGARATPEAPFAWLRMEPPAESMGTVELGLTLWPGGETRILAEVQAHAAWVKWWAPEPERQANPRGGVEPGLTSR
jgi:hypothetical protein